MSAKPSTGPATDIEATVREQLVQVLEPGVRPEQLDPDADMADVPPTLWLPFGQLTCMVRWVVPDHNTEISIAPVPMNP